MFETGIKVIDLLEPYYQGRQDRPVRRRRRRQDRHHHGAHQQHRHEARRLLGVRRRRRAHARGQRPLARDLRSRASSPRAIPSKSQRGAGLRPDDRAAGRAPARRPVGPDGRRVLPRRRRQGRAALHRQHLPLHAGRLGSVGAARPHAVGRRLPADARDRDGRAAGAHHVDEEGLDHVGAGDLRARRRLHRPRAGDDVRAPRRDDEPVARDLGAGHLPGRRSAGLDLDAFSSRASSARSTTTSPATCSRSSSATRTCRTSSRFSASTSCRKTTSSRRRARRKIQKFLSQPFFVAQQFTGLEGKYVPIADTIRGFKEIVEGKHDDIPEQAFYMVGTIEEAREKAATLAKVA